jgi:hypothetical protein
MSECLPIKVGAENESDFNNFIYVIVKRIVPGLYNLGFNANNVTTLSLIFCFLTYNNLRLKNKVCIVYYFIYMVLDYADGYMARTYNMMSNFGDVYDHARDVIFHLFILNVIYPSKALVSIFIIGLILSLNSFACQEIIYEANCGDANNNTIGWLKPFCSNNKMLDDFNKYIGSGSVYLANMIIMLIYCLT